MPTRPRSAIAAAALAVGVLVTVPACGSSQEASTENFCATFAELNANAEQSANSVLDADLDRLVATAPTDELRKAAETVRDGIDSVGDVDLDNLDNLSEAELAEMEATLDQVFTPEFEAAADQIDDYVDANCEATAGN